MFFRRPQPKLVPKIQIFLCMVLKLFAGFFFYHMYMGICVTFSENNCFWKTRRIKSCTYGRKKKIHSVKIIHICVALIFMVWYARVVFDKKMLAKNFVFFNRKPVSHFCQSLPPMSLYVTFPYPPPPSDRFV